MNSSSYVPSEPRGLAALDMHEQCIYFKDIDECSAQGCINPLPTHPFGLSLPPSRSAAINPRINFVGAHATDMSVEAFLANIRFWAGYAEGRQIQKLRVISIHEPAMPDGGHYVFFEFWSCRHVIISGETTDCSGAGNAARQELEDVFAVLSSVYKMPIERVTLNRKLDLDSLYAEHDFKTA